VAGEPAIRQVSPSDELARTALRAYMHDVVSRYHGRPVTAAEVEAALREFPNDALEPPTGLLLVAVRGGEPLGCAGLRLLAGSEGEVVRVHVVPAARRRGLGIRLMGELERRAREHGRTVLRLDTRADLVEARRLYARLGYREVAPSGSNPYAEHWFEKTL
jgi:ribosomal protein S18 acetylase RimI-like enzyme